MEQGRFWTCSVAKNDLELLATPSSQGCDYVHHLVCFHAFFFLKLKNISLVDKSLRILFKGSK